MRFSKIGLATVNNSFLMLVKTGMYYEVNIGPDFHIKQDTLVYVNYHLHSLAASHFENR